MIPFGDYLPDLPALNNPGSNNINNCLPWSPGTYIPLKTLSATSAALTAACRGAFSSRSYAGIAFTYAGEATKLYEFTGAAGAVNDRSGATYTLAAGENWEFVRWGNTVIAVHIGDAPQVATIGAGTNFAALGGSPPKARHIAVIKDFVVMGNLDEAGVVAPDKVRWSALNNSADWTASASTQSGSQVIRSTTEYGGGRIMGIRGGAFGTIFQEFSIWRMTYVGSPLFFQFDELFPGYGTPAKNSIVQYGNLIFYLGQEGFDMLVNGVERFPIGIHKVDKTFLADVDINYLYNVIGAVDIEKRVVCWIYPGSGSTAGTPNKMISYNWVTKKWAPADITAEWLFSGMGQGYTLEELDTVSSSLDALGDSLDARRWAEGNLTLTAFNTDHKQATFSGTTLAATLETSETELSPGRRTFLSGARPLIDGGSATVTPITRNLQSATASAGSAASVHSETGIAPLRSDARYHRLRVITSGNYDYAVGVEIQTDKIRATGKR